MHAKRRLIGTTRLSTGIACAFLAAMALILPSVARSEGQQWSRARKDRNATLASVAGAAEQPSKLKWRKASTTAGSKHGDRRSMVVLANATVPVDDTPTLAPKLDEATDEPPPKLRLLAVDHEEGELVPIAADDEPAPDGDPGDDTEELPGMPKRRPARPTDIDVDDDLDSSTFAMGPLQPETKCPTVKDLKSIADITNDIAPEPGKFPQECPLGGDDYVPRSFATTVFTWKASSLCHKPLYFEQAQVERYGHTFGPIVQPIFCGAHFFVSVLALPYKMGVEPPVECVYALGWYRPGSCAPRTVGPIPISARGIIAELGVGTGLNYLFP